MWAHVVIMGGAEDVLADLAAEEAVEVGEGRDGGAGEIGWISNRWVVHG